MVLRNPSSCLSRKGKSGLLPACRMIASKPYACCFGRPFHCYEKHVRGLDFKWKLLLTAAKPQHGGQKSPSSICRGSGVGKAELYKSTSCAPPSPTRELFAVGRGRRLEEAQARGPAPADLPSILGSALLQMPKMRALGPFLSTPPQAGFLLFCDCR